MFMLNIDHNNKSQFKLSPLTINCARILAAKDHVLLGISPFNSLFSEEYIEKLFVWASYQFETFSVLLPSEIETSFLLQATSKSETVARRKTRHQLARNLKAIERVMNALGLSKSAIKIIRFSDFYNNSNYQRLMAEAADLFKSNGNFRNLCLKMSLQAIQGRLKAVSNNEQGITQEQLHIAAKYIFAEIPFFINSPLLLNLESSLLVYHKPWLIGDSIYANEYSSLTVNPNQGYLIIESQENLGTIEQAA